MTQNTDTATKQTDSLHNSKTNLAMQTDKPTTKKPPDIESSEVKVEKQTFKPSKTGPQKKQAVHNTKLSLGYGSTSSSSSEPPKHGIFRQGDTQSEPNTSQKERELAGIYSSVVKVEDPRHKQPKKRANKIHVLNEKEAQVYRDITTAYREAAEQDKEKRKQLFFKKLQDVHIDSALQHNKEVAEKVSRREQLRRRQQEQLEHIRSKFEDERTKRFKTQYVTKNFLSYEKMDRVDYGLPDQHTRNTEYQTPVKRPGGVKVSALAFVKRQIKLKKSYSKMFTDPKTGKRIKDPKMEGVDQVTLEADNSHGKLFSPAFIV